MEADQNRIGVGCLCCGNIELRLQTTVVSGFLAQRAWSGAPELTTIAFCDQCGFRFFGRGLSNLEADRLYGGYRDAGYFATRNRWEPFYTREQHADVIAWSHSPSRTNDLRMAFEQAGLPPRFHYALDHGGYQGHMLQGIDAETKVVFDPAGCDPPPALQQSAIQQESRPNVIFFSVAR